MHDGLDAIERAANCLVVTDVADLQFDIPVQVAGTLSRWMNLWVEVVECPNLVPFTINGLAVREAFFVSFLTQLGVDKESALACGFLFFVVTIALALPGAVILAIENLRGVARPRAPELR